MTESLAQRARDEWVIGTLSQPGRWHPPTQIQASRHFSLYRPAIRSGNRPGIWLEDTRGDDGGPLTGQRREHRG